MLLSITHIANILYVRARHKTILGEDVTTKVPGYVKFKKMSTPLGLTVAVVVAIGCIANLVYDINRILGLGNPDHAHGMLTYAPIIVTAFFITMLFVMRSKLRSDKQD